MNLFPTRIEIGLIPTQGGASTKVYMSPEFSRALSSLFEQIGGSNAIDNEGIAVLAGFTPEPITPISAPVDTGASGSAAAEISALRDVLAQTFAQLDAARALVAPLVQRLEALELQVMPIGGPTGIDWEHPGKIGFQTPNSGSFTTLATNAGGAFSIAASSATISLSRTGGSAGTGHLGADVTYCFRVYDGAFGSRFRVSQTAALIDCLPTGLTSAAAITAATGFGCNGKAAQTAAVSGGTLAGVITALVANGILSS